VSPMAQAKMLTSDAKMVRSRRACFFMVSTLSKMMEWSDCNDKVRV